MKKIMFATGNPSKAKRFSKGLKKDDIEVLSLNYLNIDLEIKEDGKNAIENALIKARTCYNQVKMPTIGMDDNLYLENVPEDKQPGTFVRRVNGKRLNDEEMIEHYTNLVKQYGIDGKLKCKWVYGLAVINEKGEESSYTWEKGGFYMVEKRSPNMNPGYPLNSISKYENYDKYFVDMNEEEKERFAQSEDDVVNFIEKHI